ncbi:DUF1353 domain-containing protein [Agromyces sp. CFH 90414]|uniref:DUF1353 domain-containing protein n=1 Tax=Agromyces agglutinans TaxID=2662258 RepID=A0A6I2FC90_9MICO|nr:DUF1353 domain-containing protein [Agromyces agglutinans]MRG60076.1 DUF1353 domain-containing protein [Agromyces agglutinans]
MPFRRDDGAPLDELRLAQRPADGDRFDLLASFRYVDPVSGATYRVPAAGEPGGPGEPDARSTDLASVPHPLWSFVASYGRQSAPAVLHDHRSAVAEQVAERDGADAALAQRVEDDRVFRTALREQRVPLVRAWVMWAWVSADRERTYGGARGAVFVAQAVLGAIALLAGLVLAWWHPAWLALAAVAVLAALPWGRLAGLQLLLTVSGALIAPLVVVHLAPLVVFRVVEAIAEVLTGGDPAAVVRPTVAAREPGDPAPGQRSPGDG